MVDIMYTDTEETEEVRIRHIEEVDWVESSKAQSLDGRVEIQTYYTDRDYINNREITVVDLEDVEETEEAETRLKIAFEAMFDEDFVEHELIENRSLIEELVEKALD